MTFEGPQSFPADSPADEAVEATPVTADPKLAEKFAPAFKMVIDSHGVAHRVETNTDAAQLHQEDIAS